MIYEGSKVEILQETKPNEAEFRWDGLVRLVLVLHWKWKSRDLTTASVALFAAPLEVFA